MKLNEKQNKMATREWKWKSKTHVSTVFYAQRKQFLLSLILLHLLLHCRNVMVALSVQWLPVQRSARFFSISAKSKRNAGSFRSSKTTRTCSINRVDRFIFFFCPLDWIWLTLVDWNRFCFAHFLRLPNWQSISSIPFFCLFQWNLQFCLRNFHCLRSSFQMAFITNFTFEMTSTPVFSRRLFLKMENDWCRKMARRK